jgi:hypothetical protein
MELFRECQMCVIGASIYDPMRIQMIPPDHIDPLFMLFEKNGFRLRIDYIDPSHRNNVHELHFKKAYFDSIQEINIHEVHFETFMEIDPIQTDFLIVMDFTGTYTPQEIENQFQIQLKYSHTSIPYNLRTILLPMGCACKTFNYLEFLHPLLSYQEFHGLHINEFSLIQSCREIITRVNEQKDICTEALIGKDGYDKKELDSLKPYFEMLIAELDIHFDHKIILDFMNRLTTYYTDHPEHAESFEFHRNYISKTHTAIQTQIVLLISVLQGLFHYKTVKPWYSNSLPQLHENNEELIPFYIYTTLELLCRKQVVSRENTIETAISLFQEDNRKAWLQKHSPYFEPIFIE